MPDPRGDRLFVNLSANETRRRLKGFGHGVRKIQSAGRKQAVVIHTATGRHLHELEQQFADVGYSTEFIAGEPERQKSAGERPIEPPDSSALESE